MGTLAAPARAPAPRIRRPYLSHGVGGAAKGELGGHGAVGGEGRDDLGRVRDMGVVGVGPGGGASGEGEDGGELHFG